LQAKPNPAPSGLLTGTAMRPSRRPGNVARGSPADGLTEVRRHITHWRGPILPHAEAVDAGGVLPRLVTSCRHQISACVFGGVAGLRIAAGQRAIIEPNCPSECPSRRSTPRLCVRIMRFILVGWWSYGDSNLRPLACHEPPARPQPTPHAAPTAQTLTHTNSA
jgi:hypothetical protein